MRVTPGLKAASALALFALFALAAARNQATPPAPIAATSASAAAPEAPARPFVGAEHILVAYQGADGAAPTVSRTRAEAKARAAEARAQLVAQPATFEALVAAYSDDAITRPSGGKLGNFERDVFPAAFSDAAFALAIGGVSEVVETPRGFHVIVRTQ